MSSGKVTLCLDATTQKLEAFLGGAGTPKVIVVFHEVPAQQKNDTSEYPRANQFTTLAGATETTILAAPSQNIVRHVDSITINNDTGGTIVVSIVTDVSATNYLHVEQSLLDTETLLYTADDSWRVI